MTAGCLENLAPRKVLLKNLTLLADNFSVGVHIHPLNNTHKPGLGFQYLPRVRRRKKRLRRKIY